MKTSRTSIKLVLALFGLMLVMTNQQAIGQELPQTEISLNSPFHNQLFFNRFLINPTFSLVRENKSYLNILHRNQYASYEDNTQNYYLGFSNKLNDNTALGIGIYGQWEGVMQEFGFNANYATSVKLGQKSRLTFGTNFTYTSEGLDQNRIVSTEQDPTLLDTRKESKIAIQPGIALSLGSFDFGLYATDLIKYNQTANELVTNFNDRTVKAALQYTHTFKTQHGLFANARFMPLVQLGKNLQGDFAYIGSVLLDLPDYGWFQATYDQTYGASAGIGFNLNQRLSLGYVMEKDLSNAGTNLGWNHELSLAYTFKEDLMSPNSYGYNSQDAQIDQIVRNYEEQILALKQEQKELSRAQKFRPIDLANTVDDELSAYKQSGDKDEESQMLRVALQDLEVSPVNNALAMENRLILDELILRQDSIEHARDEKFEKRFETLVRTLRNEIRRTNEAPAKEPSKKSPVLLAENKTPQPTSRKSEPKVNSTLSAAYKEIKFKTQNRSDIIGVNSGYYLIANVYSNKRYLKAFMDDLNAKGLNAKQFYNKENGLYYVYLADFNNKAAAQVAAVNHLDGNYKDEKWIMQVYNPMSTAQVVFEDQQHLLD